MTDDRCVTGRDLLGIGAASQEAMQQSFVERGIPTPPGG